MIVYFTYKLSVFSLLVRFLTKQEYSHVAIYIDGYVYDATIKGCQKQRLANFLKNNYVVEAIRLPQGDHSQQLQRAISKLGTAYDVPAILWFLLFLLGARLPRLTINPRWLICSEYAWYILTGETKTVTPQEVKAGLPS